MECIPSEIIDKRPVGRPRKPVPEIEEIKEHKKRGRPKSDNPKVFDKAYKLQKYYESKPNYTCPYCNCKITSRPGIKHHNENNRQCIIIKCSPLMGELNSELFQPGIDKFQKNQIKESSQDQE